jgi:hypothetical protein
MGDADQTVCARCGAAIGLYEARCPACAASLSGGRARTSRWRHERDRHGTIAALASITFLAGLAGLLCGFVATIIVYWKPVTRVLYALGIYHDLRTEDTVQAILVRFLVSGLIGFAAAFLVFRRWTTPRR